MPPAELPEPLLRLCRALAEAGGRAFLVGGCVRDRLRELLAAHGGLNVVGEAFTVYKLRLAGADELPAIDVSLPRRESKAGRGHRAFVVTGDPALSPAEAARRRDFTVNAISLDPLSGEIVDPFDGRGDLARRLLRAVDPATFVEDSLRVLRAMQLAARLEFAIEPATAALCRGIDLSDLPAERIWGEVEKWLDRASRPSLGWHAARELGVVARLWPEIAALDGCPQEPEWHPEGDVFVHTGLVLDAARPFAEGLGHPQRLTLMLAAVAHDFGKPATTRVDAGRIRSLGHEEAGVAPALRFLERLNVQTLGGYDVPAQVAALVQFHLAPTHFWNAEKKGQRVGDGAFRRLALKVDPELLYRLALADTRGRGSAPPSPAPEWLRGRMQALALSAGGPRPLLLGRHLLPLGVPPGPALGEILRAVFERQLDGEVTTLEEAIAAARAELAHRSAR